MADKRDDKERVEFLFDHEEEVDPMIDLFADSDEPDASRSSEEAFDEASPDSADEPQSLASEFEFAFDRYGRRIDKKRKRKKSRYGKRKNAPKASTKVVQNDTIAHREYEAAQARSRQRAARREAKEAREKRIRAQQRRARLKSNLITAGLGLGALALLLVMAWYTTRIRTIKVDPLPLGYSSEDIVNASGLRFGRSILFQNLGDAKTKIEQDAYLRATLRYSFPSTITISLDKRNAAACVRWGPQSEYLAIIDSSGTVLDAEAESTGGLIVADGMSVTSAQNGKPIGSSTDLQVAGLIRILTKLEELDLLSRTPRLSRIDMSEMMSISIDTEGANYSIEVGDTSNLDTKFLLLQKHWDEIMSRAGQYIANGYSTATIYLYSKGGVAVSPYEPGYNAAIENVLNYGLPSDAPSSATPPPGSPQETPDPDAPPSESPTPPPTVMPHQGGSFTG